MLSGLRGGTHSTNFRKKAFSSDALITTIGKMHSTKRRGPVPGGRGAATPGRREQRRRRAAAGRPRACGDFPVHVVPPVRQHLARRAPHLCAQRGLLAEARPVVRPRPEVACGPQSSQDAGVVADRHIQQPRVPPALVEVGQQVLRDRAARSAARRRTARLSSAGGARALRERSSSSNRMEHSHSMPRCLQQPGRGVRAAAVRHAARRAAAPEQ